MAQELHDNYGFSYDNLKVLAGGWNAWLSQNAADPKGYPITVTATTATPGGTGQTGGSSAITATKVLTP